MGLNGMPGAGAGPGAGPGELRPCNGWVTISNRKFHGVVAARPTVENDDSVSRRTRSQLLDEPRTVVAMEWGEGMKTKQGSGAGLRYSSAGGVAWRGVRQRCEQKTAPSLAAPVSAYHTFDWGWGCGRGLELVVSATSARFG
ncbi:hypothetical protein AXG93_723s1040 [Marchantia polymorpha subsp. ruderalis]|uniref:Uncharacterized protein n=1 Tax=Marchantia polymorpha subsp. ruderalis TaxID=1480154 RepID=A0A176VD08_MARPO|nr:hypothetical protein AXG93_723s1040 [Marchantia polymorpha subsp. ruderalis]